MDEVFKSHGHRVSPMEIEAVLRTHPAVADAAVIPCPDARGGLAPYAVVETLGPCEPEQLARDLIDLAARRLAPVFVPRGVDLVPNLPRTRSGKVRRGELRPGVGADSSRPDEAEPAV
jgi:acetyl-CoA synthetase